ncbi:MAG TPA: META domain-containing protein [Dongiaceae bacterium]|nr:META domain-containing protein [Dongiaceae bacterium]
MERQPIADRRGAVICPAGCAAGIVLGLGWLGVVMRWNDELRLSPVLWRRGALVLALALAGCASKPSAPPSEPSIVGLWQAQEIAGSAVPADVRITLSMYGDGRAVGRAGCNNYTTKYQRTGDTISFAPAISTKMACAPDLMTLEQGFLDTLSAANRVERRPDGTLALTADTGAQLLFRRQEAASLQDARTRGVDFRGIGQEPGWVVEVVDGGKITAVLDYGARTLELPTPAAETAEDGTVIYDASTDTDHLILRIKRKVCVDSMSGESHPSVVDLLVNEKPYLGCGDWLD